jgi:hypothetical protein
MTILATPDLNILHNVSVKDYKRCVSKIEVCIMATDLAIFFKNKKSTAEIGGGKYDKNNGAHRDLVMGISMTCSDLSAMFKKWEDSKRVADCVYEKTIFLIIAVIINVLNNIL